MLLLHLSHHKTFLMLEKASWFVFFFFFYFYFPDCGWCFWDGEDKSHFIRLLHLGACQTWLVFLLTGIGLSRAFSGHWWTTMGPHSSWGIFNVLESTGKPQCCSPVALQSEQCWLIAFLLLSLLPPGGKIAIILLHLPFRAGCSAQGGQHRSWGTPRRSVSPLWPFPTIYFLLSPLLFLLHENVIFEHIPSIFGVSGCFYCRAFYCALNKIPINYY